MKKILSIIPVALALLAVQSCDTKVEKLEIQKQSKHTISYVYFARWAPPEGATSLFIEYKTMRPRLMALPDSLDIVNLTTLRTPMRTSSTARR